MVAVWMEAFVKAQAEFPSIHKDKTATIQTKAGGSFSYSYADLPTILEQVNPILKKHGFAVGQAVVSENGNVGVETRIYHKSGHVEVFGPLFLPSGDDARSAGSAVTYARRYSLCAALGIATDEDDDGGAASAAASTRDSESLTAADPHCPACLAVNGELVGVFQNEKAPYWKCRNKPDKCAGSAEDKNGKLWSWSGWDPNWEKAASTWLSDNNLDGIDAERVEQSPVQWLRIASDAFKEWGKTARAQAYKAVLAELEISEWSTMDEAKQIHQAMYDAYLTEYPPSSDEAPF